MESTPHFGYRRAWYLQPCPAKGALESPLARSIVDVVDQIHQHDQERFANYEKWVQLYGGRRQWGALLRPGQRPDAGFGMPVASSAPTPELAERAVGAKAPLRLNVVKAAVDTVTSKVGKMRPRPTFLTDHGNWTLKQRAQKLQRFTDGAYHQADAYEHSMEVFRDAMVLGTGVLLPHARGSKIVVERSPAWEWLVDPADAEYGEPRCLYRVRWVARERVRLVWGDKYADAGRETEGSSEDFVRVVEAWFRPLTPEDAPDTDAPVKPGKVQYCGRHVLLVDQCAVVDEYFPFADFPPVFFHWSKPVNGFWGDSAVREVEGIQVEVNRLLHTIQKSMRKVGMPWVLAPREANITPQELTNEEGLHVGFDGGTPPTVVAFQPVNPQVIQHLWDLYAKAFEILGSNQLAASATAPAGLESGRALERLSDEHSERFMFVSRAYEHAIGDQLARRFLRIAKELDATLSGGYKIRAPGTRHSLDIKWRDVEIDNDAFLMQVFPTSALPTTPGARLQEVERLQAAQIIDGEEARRLLDYPDLQQSNSLAMADYDNLMSQLEAMLERGEQRLPEPFQNLQRAVALGQASILRAQTDGAPEDHIDLVRRFVSVALNMLEEALATPTAAAPPGAAPDTMTPNAAPAEGGAPAPTA